MRKKKKVLFAGLLLCIALSVFGGEGETYGCPDGDIEILLTTGETSIGDAVQTIEHAYDIVTALGYNARKIISKSEVNAQVIKSYLSCPNLKLWIRIGHSMDDRILFADGTSINSSWISAQSTDFLKGKTICLLGGGPRETSLFTGALMDHGAYAVIGRMPSLISSPGDGFIACWLEKVLGGCDEMKEAFDQCITACTDCYDEYYFIGSDDGPWYYPSCPGPTPTPGLINVALHKPAYASAIYAEPFDVKNINDGDMTTIWGSGVGTKPQWVFIDLLQEYDIDSVKIYFVNPFYSPIYYIAVSHDKKNWEFAGTVNHGDGGLDEEIINRKARYIGLYLTSGQQNVYGIKEFEVYSVVP